MLTLALVVLFVVVTRLRRTPEVARHAALVTALIVNTVLLPLISHEPSLRERMAPG
jgi:hypothetical protein